MKTVKIIDQLVYILKILTSTFHYSLAKILENHIKNNRIKIFGKKKLNILQIVTTSNAKE